MKKLIVVTFLFFYIASYIRPFAPVIINYISKMVWEHSHKNRLEKMNCRVNFLSVLEDMAKHNSPNHDTTSHPDATKSAGSSFVCVVPTLNYNFCANEGLEKHFPNYNFNNQMVFQQITTPPPKSA